MPRVSAFQQEVLRLRAQGLTYPQIGEALGKTANHCKVEAFHGRKNLADTSPPKIPEGPPGQHCLICVDDVFSAVRCDQIPPGAQVVLGRTVRLTQPVALAASRMLNPPKPRKPRKRRKPMRPKAQPREIGLAMIARLFNKDP